MEKKSRKLGKKWIFIIAGVVVVVIAAVVVVVVIPQLQANSSSSSTTYRTQALTKGSLTSTVGATGNVYTNQSADLTWGASGTVGQVYVEKGQTVTKGTVLAELDTSSLPQSIISAQVDLSSAKEALDDLLNSTTDRANAELALIQAEQSLVDAQTNAQSKQYQRASQETIDIAQANLILAQNSLDNAQQVYDRNKNRSTSDVEYANALSQFASAQQKFDQAQANLYYVEGLPDATDVQEANAEVDVAEATYLDAKRAWERVKDGPNADDVAAAEAKVTAAQATIDSAKIIAPFDGTVMAIDTKAGDVISSGATAFELDDLSHLYTDIQVSEVDINQVKVGQSADITFDAISDKTYTGQVTDIDTVGTTSSGSVNFNVTVEITNPDSEIKPGMTTTADIAVVQVTDALLVPSSAIRTVNNQEIVYVSQNGALRPVTVTVGQTDDTNSQITSGNLQEGDLIVLNPPSTTTTTSTSSNGLLGGLFGGLLGGGRSTTGGGGQAPSGGFDGGSGGPPSGGPGGSSGGPSGSSGGN